MTEALALFPPSWYPTYDVKSPEKDSNGTLLRLPYKEPLSAKGIYIRKLVPKGLASHIECAKELPSTSEVIQKREDWSPKSKIGVDGLF